MAYYDINRERNRIDIHFDRVPPESIRDELKSSGWFYNWREKYWYHYDSFWHRQMADYICAAA